jgi:hypothetical protein
MIRKQNRNWMVVIKYYPKYIFNSFILMKFNINLRKRIFHFNFFINIKTMIFWIKFLVYMFFI